MAFRIVRTTVTETHCELRFADEANDEKANAWIDVRLPLSELAQGSGTALSENPNPPLSTVRGAVLRYLQTLATDEIRRLTAGQQNPTI
jgi:hypothetical protein